MIQSSFFSSFSIVLGLWVTASVLPAEPIPDFSLVDQNPSSPRFGNSVSPRDYRHQVSAYYFGSAT
ncbi:MAG: hypothetical protein CMP31_04215 [Roseibacillus sp.]|jgi:hypothetical protein|nr:hypothetical protein [Roseibacillus sp.]